LLKTILSVVLIVNLAGYCHGGTYGRPGLSFKAGIGYDFLSQEYFLDSLGQSGVDSLDITTALETTYLENLKGQMALRYNPFQDYRLELEGIYEQTSEEHRIRSYANIRPKLGAFRLDWSSDLDWRRSSVTSEIEGTGYFSGNSRIKVALPVSPSVSLWTRVKAEVVSFDSSVWGAFDHHRFAGELGISHIFSGFSSLSVAGFVTRREVPDSRENEYKSFGVDGSLLRIYDKGEVDVLTHLESRDYARPDNLDDYLRFDLDFRHRHGFTPRYFLRGESEIEIIAFDSTDYLTSSYTRFELAILPGLSGLKGSVAVGPRIEILAEGQVDPLLIGEDYVEYSIKGELDVLSPGWPFLSVETITGRRNLTDEATSDGLQTDFVVERLSLLADWLLVGHLNLNLLFSADWEWHDDPNENNRLVLVSSCLTYSF